MRSLLHWILKITICLLGLSFLAGIVLICTLNVRLAFSEQYDYQSEAPGQFVTINGYTLHYQIIGPQTKSPPLLFLHGFNAAASHEWHALTPYLPDRQLILIDHLGMGHSQRISAPDDVLSIAGQSTLYADFITALGFETVDLVGVSYSGAIAAQLAADYPQHVANLILIGPQVNEFGGGGFATLAKLPLGIGSAMTYFAMGAGTMGTTLYALECDSTPIGFCPTEADRAIRQRLAEIKGTTASFRAYSQTPTQTSLPAALQTITQPTLLLYGENDFSQGAFQAEVEQLLQNEQTVIIPDNYHTPHLQSPAVTAEAIEHFLTK